VNERDTGPRGLIIRGFPPSVKLDCSGRDESDKRSEPESSQPSELLVSSIEEAPDRFFVQHGLADVARDTPVVARTARTGLGRV
jgi:hypothetical protein